MKTNLFWSGSIPLGGVGVLAVALLSVPAFAADKPPAPAGQAPGAPDMGEMMKKMEELATPAAEHQILASLAGEWDTEVRCFMSDAPTVNRGLCKSRMILGGRFLQEEFDGEMMGQKFQGMGLTGYDKMKKKFIGTWVDSMGTSVFITEGTADSAGKVITMEGKMADPMTGEKDKAMRVVTRIVSPNKHTFEMHDLSLGEKSKVMEITYVRKGTATTPAVSKR